MDDLTLTLVRHRDRVREVGDVLARFGLAAWVSKALTGLLTREADPALAGMSEGEQLRGALVELGTTWVKFGQMLSLRSDLVGDDVARELTKLQANVPADPAGVAHARVEAELGASTDELTGRSATWHRATPRPPPTQGPRATRPR